jgi:hypothetical protein
MQTNTERPTSNFKNLVSGREGRGISKELKNVMTTSPWFTIVAVMLFNKEFTRARQRGVVACFFIPVVRYPMVPKMQMS